MSGRNAKTKKGGMKEPTPVDLGIATLGENLLDDFGVEKLGEVLADESDSLLRAKGRHDGRS